VRFRTALLAFVCSAAIAAAPAMVVDARPRITGISHIAVYTSDSAATNRYYTESIGAARITDPENPEGVRYAINATQFVEVLPLVCAGICVNRLDHTAYNTDNAENLRRYLKARGWKTPAMVTRYADGSMSFRVDDPEGNVVEFVQPPPHPKVPDAPNGIGHHIIHIGMLVHSREAEDKFYKDLLGFKPYWFGGMVEGKTDWVSQQVPDGHDWLEYMLSSGKLDMSGKGIPAGMSQQALGVLDHLSIGVVSVPNAYKKLVDDKRMIGKADRQPQIGKDGKYQFNLYDPDGIRTELMEFHATEKPCCSPFTAPDPAPE